jgi:hypothetical protein
VVAAVEVAARVRTEVAASSSRRAKVASVAVVAGAGVVAVTARTR